MGNKVFERKGTTGMGILFFVFVFIMIIIGGGIAGGMFAFFGKGYEFKRADASALFDKVRRCLEEGNDFFKSGFDELIFENCGLNENVFGDNYLIYIKDVGSGKKFSVGRSSFLQECFFKDTGRNSKFAKCVKGNVDFDGKIYELIVGSNQNSKGVAT